MIGELNQSQMELVLKSEVVGRIGCHAEGKTYVVPVTYAYHDGYIYGYIYGHSAEGLKINMMRANPKVCFEVDDMDSMRNWRSVIVQGQFEELSDKEAGQAMHFLMERMAPLMVSETGQPHSSPHGAEAKQAVVYRIRVESMTGRYEKP